VWANKYSGSSLQQDKTKQMLCPFPGVAKLIECKTAGAGSHFVSHRGQPAINKANRKKAGWRDFQLHYASTENKPPSWNFQLHGAMDSSWGFTGSLSWMLVVCTWIKWDQETGYRLANTELKKKTHLQLQSGGFAVSKEPVFVEGRRETAYCVWNSDQDGHFFN
jgi:hypothetical protein